MKHIIIALVVVAALALPSPAGADSILTVKIQSVVLPNTPAGVSGFLDVFFEVSPGDALQIWGGDIHLTLAPEAGLTLGLPGQPLLHTPSFSTVDDCGSGPSEVFAAAFNLGSMDNSTIVDGLGFISIPFTAPAGAVGTWTVSIDPDNTTFALMTHADPLVASLPYAIENGTITIIPAEGDPDPAPVPLPLAMHVAPLAIGLLSLRRGCSNRFPA